MFFSDLAIGDWFRLVEPDPDDPVVYVKTEPRGFVNLAWPDGTIFRLTKKADPIAVEKVEPKADVSQGGVPR